MKIRNVSINSIWSPKFNVRPLRYDFIVQLQGLNIYGEVGIDFIAENVTIDIDKKMGVSKDGRQVTLDIDYFAKSEEVKFAVAKEVFHKFCIKTDEFIEEFDFVYREEEADSSVLGELLKHNLNEYDNTKKNEKVIYSIVDAIAIIKSLKGQDSVKYLDSVANLKERQRIKAIEIINRYLRANRIPGTVREIEVGYDCKTAVVYVLK